MNKTEQNLRDLWDMMKGIDERARQTILANNGHISTPDEAFRNHLKDAAKRTWKLFYDTVPNAKEILESADAYK